MSRYGSGVTPEVLLDTPQGSIPLKYTVEEIPEQPDAQVAATIARMCQYVCEDSQSAPIKYDAQQAVAGDPSNPLQAVHSFVRSRMRFKRDEETCKPFEGALPQDGQQHYFVEALHRPIDISLQYAATGEQVDEDCDGFASYCAAILQALGIDCCFATVAANKEDPSVFSHVYVVAYWRGQRYAMDCSHGQYAGWEVYPPGSGARLQEWPVVNRPAWGSVGVGLLLAGFAAWKWRKEIGAMFT